ncbi:T9SS type A sorting domain-containing protein [Polaribacter sp. SA4-12]|uniref:T9SS type A sorting domain-containing protein n=1 Tax=Polaribacter sp. SA4-12 TaxID=1312072 RepID=UPI000B5496DC|nr:T9SS type A sorting domain-containing protein [Polaribacter sp. SA4-12]ARV14421.1 hypothetical protein BTO07_04320 [Polaribacter sp. SA4-12]
MKKITLLLTLFVATFGFSQNLPFDFSSANQLMPGGDGAVTTIVQDGANDVLQIVGAQNAWDHAAITFKDNIDLSDDANNTITFKIKPMNGTGNGNHLLKFEGGVAGPAIAEMPYTTTGTDWQTVTVDFGTGLGNYSKMVLFVDSGADNAGVSDTYLVDDISGAKHTTVVIEAPNLPFDFSSANQLMPGGDGAVTTIVQDGANDVLQIVGAQNAWDHAAITFKDNIDLSDDANNTITFKIKPMNGTGNGNHLLKFEGGVAGPAIAEMPYTTTGTDWQTITVDFGTGLGNYSKMVLFVDSGADNAGVSDTYLVDDIALTTSSTGGGGGGTSDDAYCEKVVTHLNIGAALVASEIKLTVENSGEKSMKVTIESNNDDAVDFILIPGDVTGSPTQSAVDSSVVGKLSITLTWEETAPTDVALNILWSKVSTEGNWQLGDAPTTFKFDASCETASVRDNTLLNVTMYPNPTSSRLNISAKSTIKSAAIFNLLGKQVMSLEINKTSESIDVSNLSSGIYLIKYTVNNAVGTAKFIKE